MIRQLDLLSPASFAAGFPYEHFRARRDETPVFHLEHPHWPEGFWNVTRHADVQRVSRDTGFSNQPTPFLSDRPVDHTDPTSQLLISLDPPDHTKLRKLVNRGFTPRRVADLTERVQATVDRLIDDVAERGGCDMVSELAVELPLQVIADLVGVPEADRHMIFEWTEQTFGFDPDQDPAVVQEASAKLFMYADKLCAERQLEPRDDLITVLLQAEVDGERLAAPQIGAFFMLLQNAGSETTRNLITSGTQALLEHPDQLEKLQSTPEIMPTAVEELLRYVSPVVQFVRRPQVDTAVGGVTIPAGAPTVIWYPSANRDERVFAEPDQLDLTRSPNDHVAFGAGGPHFCLGASLARLEARLMFDAIANRFVDLEIDGDADEFPRVWSNLVDGFAAMPITWSDVKPAARS